MQSAAPERPTSRHQHPAVLVAILGAGLLLALGGLAPAALAATPTPPFLQCPALDEDSSCQYLIYVTGTGSTQNIAVLDDSSQPFYDGSDDTLVGIVNDSATPLSDIYVGVDGSDDEDFGFDGDGMCNPDDAPIPAGCPFAGTGGSDDPYDYEGPDTNYIIGTINGNPDTDAGEIQFPTPLAPGQSTFFSLEAAPEGLVAGSAPISYILDTELEDVDATNSATNSQLSEPAPIDVTDTATLDGTNADAVSSGDVIYRLYTDSACTVPVIVSGSPYTSVGAVTDGQAAPSSAIGANLPTNAIYYWQTEYENAQDVVQAMAPCGQETMVFGTAPTRPAVTVSATASGGGASGVSLTVTQGTTVTASATIAPGTGSQGAPTGYAYYTWYSDNGCTQQIVGGAAGQAAVTNGSAGSSSAVTLPVGTSYLQVVYSGDASNAPTAVCTAVNVVVNATTTSTASSTTTTTTTTTSTTTTTTSTTSMSTYVPPPPPVLYKDVNVTPVSGQVYVKLPGGAGSALAAILRPLAAISLSKGQGFIPLSQARQIPVGSILDTRAGTVKVTAASTKAKQQYTANITAGIFELEQNRKQKGLTQLTLMDTANGRKVCASKGKKTPHYGPLLASAAKSKSVGSKVLGLLKSTDTGKFQTKGDFASATVRGTQYSVTDECAGTLTSVSRGTVTVDYFARRSNVVVKAGYYYLAKASGAKSKVQKIGK